MVQAQDGLPGKLRAHVEKLAGEIGERNEGHYEGLLAARDYVAAAFKRNGYGVSPQSYILNGRGYENLIAEARGTEKPQEIVVIGAHYDSVAGSPGADDNASGAAVLLELSAALKDLRPKKTVRFIAFVNEEPPYYRTGAMGSRWYVRSVKEKGENVAAMLSLEMLGCFSDAPKSQKYPPLLRWFYPSTGNFIAFVGNFASRALVAESVKAFEASSPLPVQSIAAFEFIPGVGWSDHESFWRAGYHALMVTDTAFNRYAFYHTAADTPEKLDYARMAQAVEGLKGVLLRLAY
ncbi:MAG: M20/M25/M40 family metallo-hydrolase [Elusimicrobia bacterium]|nr:M20/M25/M40 family metallo-hydrolase [Elusimicrobiota bacterium]